LYRFLLIILLSIFCRISYLYGNTNNFCYRSITIENGLSQSTVNCILLDMKGTLWIGTNYGLNSFNRNEVTSYTHDANNASSLPGDVINFIMEDSHHNLWVSTNNGLAMYNPIDKRFITIIPRRVIQSYLLLDDGILFSAAGYFFKYYYQDQHLQRIAILHANRPSDEAFSKMHRIDRNRVLLVGANNVYVLTLNDWRLHYWFSM
jgi:hypothetical protein